MKSLEDQTIACAVLREDARAAGDLERAEALGEVIADLRAKIARRDAIASLNTRPVGTSAIEDRLQVIDHAVEQLPRHEREIMLREVLEAWQVERKKAEPAD